MSLIALKFVLAALIVLIIVGLMWLAAELIDAPANVRRLAGGILIAALAIGLVVLVAAIAGGLYAVAVWQ